MVHNEDRQCSEMTSFLLNNPLGWNVAVNVARTLFQDPPTIFAFQTGDYQLANLVG